MTTDTRYITRDHDEWPFQLDLLLRDEAPAGLWVRGTGHLADLAKKSVVITGSRAATMYGEQVALDMAQSLAHLGYTIVNGGGFGIDAAALRGTMRKPAIVVLACGVDRAYPAAHENIFADVLHNGGLIVSEVEPGTAPNREQFLARLRIAAALTRGTVIVEAGLRSSAMVAASRASEISRPVMAVPGPITSHTSAGTGNLIRAGHELVMGYSDVAARLYQPEDD